MMRPGDLVRDTSDGDIGLVVSEVRAYGAEVSNRRVYHKDEKYAMVLWPSNNGEVVKMDLLSVKNGWVEVISEEV